MLGPVQTSNYTCVKANAYETNLLFSLICIRFGTCEVRRLNGPISDLINAFKGKGGER